MSDTKKRSKFFREIDEVDPYEDSAQLLGTHRAQEAGRAHSSFFEPSWHTVDNQVYGDGEDLFTFIYGDDYYNTPEEDDINVTYKKVDKSDMFVSRREEFPDFFIDHRLECKMTENMGRGVFAKETIPKNTLIESAPVILTHANILKEITAIHGKTTLGEYPFGWGKNGLMAISMGWGGIYNHKARPNVYWKPNYKLESLEYTTIREIEKGEQLFIRYLPVWQLEQLWFHDEESEEIVEERNGMGDAWRENASTPTSWKILRPGLNKLKK